MALSCYRTIYRLNVEQFGRGRWLGAVNGMRPPRPFPPLSSKGISELGQEFYEKGDMEVVGASVDRTCLQSKEVWTGTTYALAAAMLQEALVPADSSAKPTSFSTSSLVTIKTAFTEKTSPDTPSPALPSPALPPVPTFTSSLYEPSASELVQPLLHSNGVERCEDSDGEVNKSKRWEQTALSTQEREELRRMSRNTARGIHDAGWQSFGYWFATPEAWNSSG